MPISTGGGGSSWASAGAASALRVSGALPGTVPAWTSAGTLLARKRLAAAGVLPWSLYSTRRSLNGASYYGRIDWFDPVTLSPPIAVNGLEDDVYGSTGFRLPPNAGDNLNGYLLAGGGFDTVESAGQFVVPAGTVGRLFVVTSAPVGGTVTYTVRRATGGGSPADTAISVTIAGGSQRVGSSAAISVATVDNDLLSLHAVGTAIASVMHTWFLAFARAS